LLLLLLLLLFLNPRYYSSEHLPPEINSFALAIATNSSGLVEILSFLLFFFPYVIFLGARKEVANLTRK